MFRRLISVNICRWVKYKLGGVVMGLSSLYRNSEDLRRLILSSALRNLPPPPFTLSTLSLPMLLA
jgi:hypothetical protein